MGKKIILYTLKIIFLALPLLSLKMVQEPTYLVDARLVQTAKQLPPDEDIAAKAYSQKEHTVAIMTNEYYQQNKGKWQEKVVTYQQNKERLEDGFKSFLMKQTSYFMLVYFLLTFIGKKIQTWLKKKASKTLTYSEGGTTIRPLDDFQHSYWLLMPSLVTLLLVGLQWGKLTTLYWLGETFHFRTWLIVFYALDLVATCMMQIIYSYQLIVDKHGIRGRCPANVSKSITLRTMNLDINWERVDNAYIQRVEATTNESGTDKTDAYTQLVLQRPAGNLQNLPKINIEYYDEDALAACLNHYYAEYKQDPEAKILEV